jgi:hypothetical protein
LPATEESRRASSGSLGAHRMGSYAHITVKHDIQGSDVNRTQLSKRMDPSFEGNNINPTAMLKLVERHHIIPV